MAARKTSKRKESKSASKMSSWRCAAVKSGTLKSGKSGKKVTSKKQAIAIGLSEARKKGRRSHGRKVRNDREAAKAGHGPADNNPRTG